MQKSPAEFWDLHAEAQYIIMECMYAAQKEFESMFPPLDEEFLRNASDRELAALMRIYAQFAKSANRR